jgi:hypothetical protein
MGIADIERILEIGLQVFSRWGLASPCAFRAGNLQVDKRIYPLLEQHGIPLASNVGLGTYWPNDPELCLAGGRHWIGRTLEIPVSSYVDVRLPGIQRRKTFTVIGTGGLEARQWLLHAAESGIGPVVVLTHPADFVHKDGENYTRLRRNEMARRRLRELCSPLPRIRQIRGRAHDNANTLDGTVGHSQSPNGVHRHGPSIAGRRKTGNRIYRAA